MSPQERQERFEPEPDFAIAVEGATEEELRRGIAAAQAVFDAAGVTPLEAATSEFRVEGDTLRRLSYDSEEEARSIGGPPEATERQYRIAGIWRQADLAAVEACCAGWTRPAPDPAKIEILSQRRALD
jgi:hypothetical protein